MKMRGLILIVLYCFLTNAQGLDTNLNEIYMEVGKEYLSTSPNYKNSELKIYCYRGHPKTLIHIWHSVNIKLNIANENFVQYEGFTPEEVFSEYEQHRSSWSLNLFTNKRTNIKLNPFNQSCIGIDSYETYSVLLNVIRIDFWKFMMLGLGLTLFLSGKKLSENSIFYYICGITFGISASFLILIYLVSKLVPGRTLSYGFIAGGWTVGVYFIQILWDNIRLIAASYKTHILWYTVITGIISFLICYRYGPIQNPKNKKIIQWSLQIAGILLVALHSYYQEAAIAICFLLILYKYFPRSVVDKSHKIWRRQFPPKIKLLTSEEYDEEGVRETCIALKGLREFCESPDCKQWTTMLKLKNPKRFAEFMEGSSHLSDEEILAYESVDEDTTVHYRRNNRNGNISSNDGNQSNSHAFNYNNITDDSLSD